MNFSPNGFECSKCGICCTGFGGDFGVFVFDFEVGKLTQALQLSSEVVIENYLTPYRVLEATRQIQVYLVKHIEGNCIFLKDKLCCINDVKPIQCRRGPFGFLWDGKNRYPCMEGILSNGWSSSRLDIDFIETLI